MKRSALVALCLAPTLVSMAMPPPPATPDPVRFVDVTEAVGIDFRHEASPTSQKYLPETMGSGVALFDADGDGRLDIFFVNGAAIRDPMPSGAMPVKDGPRYWNRLYQQREDGHFEDVTARAGLAGAGYGQGVAVGDYDNDGHEDLYVTGLGGNRLYHNDGHGRFADVTTQAGVAGSGWSTSATFVDFDHDGRLDLFVCRYLVWSFEANPYCGEPAPGPRAYCHPDRFKGASPLLFHNEGGGRFKDVSGAAGVAGAPGKSLGVALSDFDHDGIVDLAVANDSVAQFLYRGRGHGLFEDVALGAGTGFDQDGRAFAGMGVDFADYDNDGWPDVVVTNLSNERYALFRNAGNGTFSYETHASGLGTLTHLSSGWGVRFLDYDNDGWKDLFVAQGHVMDTIEQTSPHLRYRQPPLLARNEAGRFRDVSATSGAIFNDAWAARGLAIGDLDDDGDLDVVVSTAGGRAYVLRNEGGNRGHWIELRLIGHRSNRDGLGADIRLVTASGALRQATASTTGSYLSASDRRVHLGLGSETKCRSIEVRWPSGIVQRLADVRADQILTVTEPDASGS
jgi:enediyne biosynthesis protein E4